MAEQSVTRDLIKYVTGQEGKPKPLRPQFATPAVTAEQLNEKLADLTQQSAQATQGKLKDVRGQLKSEIAAEEERRREEAQAWEMYSRNYQEQHGSKAPPDRTTEHGKQLFASYFEQTYKPYKAAWKKAIEAAREEKEVKKQFPLGSPERTAAW